jgi:hypothetical protein
MEKFGGISGPIYSQSLKVPNSRRLGFAEWINHHPVA